MKTQVNSKPYKPYIIFDIDGTLANIKHRLQHINKSPPNWNSFNDAMEDDTLNCHIAEIYYRFCNSNGQHQAYPAIFVSGRPETHRVHTEKWLMQHKLIPNYLYMRPANDYRSDVEIKCEIVQKYIGNAPVFFVVDDRDAVVAMWRELGYKCLQCQKGDY